MGHMLLGKDTMFSVRETPWHGLGVVLDDYPKSIDDALEKSGLGWRVRQGDVLVTKRPEWTDDFGVVQPAVIERADGYRANLREDDGAILGIVSEEYKIVQNEEAFRFLDDLINSDLHYETAGSLMNGKRVWVLVRLPDFVEVGGDDTAMFVYCTNGYDGSTAVVADVTDVRVVCWNTLSWALRKSEARERTFRFQHTGDLQVKFDEARKVMGLTLNYAKQFKEMGDRLAQARMTDRRAEKLAGDLFPVAPEATDRKRKNRDERVERILANFRGKGADGDTSGNSPNTAWCYANAVAEYADWQRRYTKTTDQVQRSMESDGGKGLKQRGLDQAREFANV